VTVTPVQAPSSEDLRGALDGEMRRRGRAGIASLVRRPHPYRTSFPLEDLDVMLDDGTRVDVVFKDLGLDRMEDSAKAVKESALHEPGREIEAYRLLDGAGLGTPTLYGVVDEPGRHWLFVERVAGVPLWQVGERDVWKAAAAWLAGLHARFLGMAPGAGSALLVRDRAHAKEALRRAIGHASGRARVILERIDPGYDEVLDGLGLLPPTLVHGDFHASNVLVDRSRTPPRIAPADWEMAGIGSGLLDLASLVAGRWSESDRLAMVTAYASAASGQPPGEEFLADLERCRLHNAVGLLALSPRWQPPSEHAHDWLGEAESAARRLGVL
jgi:aminoglycoside phosphotransferase (APT) family kinase protein